MLTLGASILYAYEPSLMVEAGVREGIELVVRAIRSKMAGT